jgi:hypothetical protein
LRDARIALPALAGMVLLAFGACLTASFHFDDYALFNDPAVTSREGWRLLWRWEQTRPLTYFTFWINHAVGGAHAAGYHAVSLALHLAAVLLLFTTLRRRFPLKVALAAAVLFGIHPIQTEAVVYVYQRATLLAALLCVLALRDWLASRHWRAVLWFGAALLAKQDCAAFPVFLALLELSERRAVRPWRPLVAMAAMAVAAGVRVMLVLREPASGAGAGSEFAWWTYLAAQGPVIWRYLRLLVIPWGFSVDPEIRVPSLATAASAWAGIAAAAAVALRRFWGAREGFWLVGGLVLLLPSSSVFPADDLAADRRMYLPLIALSPAAALVAARVRWRYLAVAAAPLLILTFGRVEVWQSEERLWTEAVARAPRKVRPRLQLARVVDNTRSLALLEEAKTLAPDDPRVASELGARYLAMGRAAEALAEFGRALALAPGDAGALNNRGSALLALGQREAARSDFERALAVDPCLEAPRRNLAALGLPAETRGDCRPAGARRRVTDSAAR